MSCPYIFLRLASSDPQCYSFLLSRPFGTNMPQNNENIQIDSDSVWKMKQREHGIGVWVLLAPQVGAIWSTNANKKESHLDTSWKNLFLWPSTNDNLPFDRSRKIVERRVHDVWCVKVRVLFDSGQQQPPLLCYSSRAKNERKLAPTN